MTHARPSPEPPDGRDPTLIAAHLAKLAWVTRMHDVTVTGWEHQDSVNLP